AELSDRLSVRDYHVHAVQPVATRRSSDLTNAGTISARSTRECSAIAASDAAAPAACKRPERVLAACRLRQTERATNSPVNPSAARPGMPSSALTFRTRLCV